MNTKISSFTLLLTFAVFFGYGQDAKLSKSEVIDHYSFNTDSLLHHVKVLSSDAFEGRRTGTKGAEKAKEYIIEKFRNLAIKPLDTIFEQKFSFDGRGKSYDGGNILGLIKGASNPEEYIVISAHYDHEGIKNNEIYNGADDDAAGISALFAFGEYFQSNPPKYSVILAAFDAEELGLQGSKYFVEHSIVPLENIKMNLNMDMISRNDKNELYVTGTSFNDTLKKIISKVKTQNGFTLLMGHDGKDGLQDWTFSSDQGSFHKKNIPFLYFGAEDHKDYHQPTDDFENIHPEFYKNVVETIISVFSMIDDLKF